MLHLQEISVFHILKGKAVSQTLRGHFIIEQCLPILIAGNLLDMHTKT